MLRSPWIIQVTLNPMTNVLIRGRRREDTQRGWGNVTIEAESGEMHPKPKDAGGPLEAERDKGGSSQSLQSGVALKKKTWVWTLGLQDRERINYCYFKPPVCDNLSWQAQETNRRNGSHQWHAQWDRRILWKAGKGLPTWLCIIVESLKPSGVWVWQKKIQTN